jgi:Zn-dependent M28 family amino/carboxypeptidase
MRRFFKCLSLFACLIFILQFLAAQNDLTSSLEVINANTLAARVQFLSDDLLGGRAVGSMGSKIARLYIANQMKLIGLKPGYHDSSYFQKFDMIEIELKSPITLKISAKKRELSFNYYDEFIAFPGMQKEHIEIKNAELVFAGYGIQAPEFQWDDFKDAAMEEKVLLVMNNDPAPDDPEFFAGKARLYYGRWDYKYEQAARMGAAGAIIIHTTPSAGYPWKVVQTSWSGLGFELPQTERSGLKYKGWITEEVAYKIVEMAGKDLDKLRKSAEKRDFKPVPLGIMINGEVNCSLRSVKATNVLGVMPGSDPELKEEALVFTAHYDHLGIGKSVDGDSIYNGALDNASGVSSILMLAQGFKQLNQPPRRSIVFLAVDGEESGLLGSEHFCEYPTFPAGKIAANINIDGINIWGKTRDIALIGWGKSTMDDAFKQAAAEQGRTAMPDPSPEQGYFYRADQFSFAKIGVPCLYIIEGRDFIGRPAGWGAKTVEHWIDTYYHQPADEYSQEWDLSGAVEDLQLVFKAALKIASDDQLPTWLPGDEFEAMRKKTLEEAKK